MINEKIENIVIENAKIMYKNFSGERTQFNAAGDRNFCVIINDEEVANNLKEIGWNIKSFTPKDDTDETIYYLKVSVNFNNVPPKIIMVTRNNKTIIDEETVNLLDSVDINNIDLVIRPYHWVLEGKNDTKEGIKAYLKTMYVTIEEDEFAYKYE